MCPSTLTKAVDMNSAYLGIDGVLLMENAGNALAKHCEGFDSIAVFAGLGNNGGDGLVAARHLSGAKKKVCVYTLYGKRSRECQKNLGIIEKLDSINVEIIRDSKDCKGIDLDGFSLIIDALLGVGVRGELREPIKSIVDLINSSNAYKIAADCPTPGIVADLTLSFHLPKTSDAKTVDIGVPTEAVSCCGPGDVYLAVPERVGGEHKGEFGRLLIVGGSKIFSKTPVLVGNAALRTGVDLARICAPSYAAKRMHCGEDLLVYPLDSEDYLAKSDVKQILEVDFDSIVIGNGLGTMDETAYALKKLLRKVDTPVVLDADALKLIKPKQIKENFILTPHAKEFEILFGEYPVDRLSAVEEYSQKTSGVILLKGEVDIISDGKKTKKNHVGNPGMTVGGTGDVLAGIVGALSCKTDPFRSACAGAFISGIAGDFAFKEFNYSLTATDCIDKIPEALYFCREFI